MSIIRARSLTPSIGRHDGEKATVGTNLVRYTPEQRRVIRAGEMLRKRLDGWHTDDIAAHYGIGRRHVNFEIRDLPDWFRERVVEEHRRGQLRMA